MINPPADLCPTCGCLPDQTHTDPAYSTSDDLAVAGAFENRSLYRAPEPVTNADRRLVEQELRDFIDPPADIVVGVRFGRFAAENALKFIEQQYASLASKDAEIAGLRAAAIALVEKLRVVHDSHEYEAVWQTAQFHHGSYRGPTYVDELAALNTALAAGKEQGDA